jgi:hypothetical protein
MHELGIRIQARRLMAGGLTTRATAARLGLAYGTVVKWRRHLPSDDAPACPLTEAHQDAWCSAYLYLLGQYLGDGHLVTSTRVPVLRLYASTDYPRIIADVQTSLELLRGRDAGVVNVRATRRMVTLQSYWKHWTCVLPQHGPGRKHERSVVLLPWQRELAAAHPWPLIRGLIHSDGCRALNVVTTNGKRYSYPRYFFANESRDILRIMGDCLDTVEVPWRFNRPNSISVARRDGVALMELHVGPKC